MKIVEKDDIIHIDRLLKLYSASGYNEAMKEFRSMFFGGEPAEFSFERALLKFFEAKVPEDSISTSLFNCFRSASPEDQLSALNELTAKQLRGK